MADNVIPESDEIFVNSGVDVIAITGSPAYSFNSDPDTGMFTSNASQVTIQAVSSGTWFLPPTGFNFEFALNPTIWTFDSVSISITSVSPVVGADGEIYGGGYNPYLNYNKIVQEVELKPEVEIDPTDIFEIF